MFKKFITICAVLFMLSGCSEYNRPEFDAGKISINGNVFNIEIANTNKQKSYGMMYMKEVPEDYGMLFVYEKEGLAVMWMKNTYVSLDMLFLNKLGIITHIEENTEPLSLTYLKSDHPTKYVLETKAGLSNSLNIQVGDRVSFLK